MIELVPVWSGALEAAGQAAFSLSSYDGRSSLYHSANWERLDTFERGEVKGHGERGPDRQPRAKPGTYDAAVLEQLKRGASYGAIGRNLGISPALVRNVARKNGIDRSMFSGCNQFRGLQR